MVPNSLLMPISHTTTPLRSWAIVFVNVIRPVFSMFIPLFKGTLKSEIHHPILKPPSIVFDP